MPIIERHLLVLKKCNEDLLKLHLSNVELSSTWVGRSAKSWFDITTKGDGRSQNYSDTPFDRTSLRSYVISQKNQGTAAKNLFEIVVNILAWGGMSYRHGRKALSCWDKWEPICLNLINGKTDFIEAYESFSKVQHSGEMSGIGPAYYTKLIFFLGSGSGLIMDQWTSKSVNLIYGDHVIKLSGGYVSQSADSKMYEKYIQCVSELAVELGIAGSEFERTNQTEELIFSLSAKKKPKFLTEKEHITASAWRAYVDKEWRP
jgi:hypothetical protein